MKDMFKQEIAIFSEDASLIYPLFFLSSLHNRNHKHTYTASLQKKSSKNLIFFVWNEFQTFKAALLQWQTKRLQGLPIKPFFLYTFEYAHL